MTEENGQTPGSYRTQDGRVYQYRAEVGDWDFDHPRACLFTFVVAGSERSFEKVIAVEPEEVVGCPVGSRLEAALQAAEAKLFHKLELGNEADEPTPLL